MDYSSLSTDEKNRLLQATRNVIKKAYAPYSNFRVGAAILTDKGKIYTGCNVENSSYGLTICAERTAIFSSIVEEGGDKMKIRALAVLNELNTPCSPCGACRQVILEFGPNAIILFQGHNGIQEMSTANLLPEGFRM